MIHGFRVGKHFLRFGILKYVTGIKRSHAREKLCLSVVTTEQIGVLVGFYSGLIENLFNDPDAKVVIIFELGKGDLTAVRFISSS